MKYGMGYLRLERLQHSATTRGNAAENITQITCPFIFR